MRKRPKGIEPGSVGSAAACAISLDSDDDPDPPPPKAAKQQQEPEDGNDEEVVAMEEAPPPAKKNAPAASSSALDDDEDDVAFLHRSGDLALLDYPHARENCMQCPFVTGKYRQHCPNCYCYVCDAPASGCPKWTSHAPATHTSDAWKQQREEWRRNGGGGGGGGGGSGGGGGASAPNGSSKAAGKQPFGTGPAASVAPARPVWNRERWSCDELLKATEMVFPIEEPEPVGLVAGTRLRPYQKQSLAFMKQVERATEHATEGRSTIYPGLVIRGGWLADEVMP